jgi:hypothetical protein
VTAKKWHFWINGITLIGVSNQLRGDTGSTKSRGYTTTHDAAMAREPDHRFLVVFGGLTRPSVVRDWIATHRVRTLNIAGNRESPSPGIGARVEAFLAEVFTTG